MEYCHCWGIKLSCYGKKARFTHRMVPHSGQNPLFDSQVSGCGKQVIVTHLAKHSQLHPPLVCHCWKMLFSSESNHLPAYTLTLSSSPRQQTPRPLISTSCWSYSAESSRTYSFPLPLVYSLSGSAGYSSFWIIEGKCELLDKKNPSSSLSLPRVSYLHFLSEK